MSGDFMRCFRGFARAFIAFLALSCLAISFSRADEPATHPSLPSPAVIHVRQVAMVPQMTINAYAMRISDIDEKTRDVVADAFDRCRDAEAAIITEAKKHPENELELIARVKKELAKLAMVGKSSGLSPERDGRKLAQANAIANYESAIFRSTPQFYALHKATDPMPKLLASLHLSDEQTIEVKKIRNEAVAQDKAVRKEEADISDKVEAFDSKLWELESDAVGIRAAEKFRRILTPQQLAEWKQELLAKVPLHASS